MNFLDNKRSKENCPTCTALYTSLMRTAVSIDQLLLAVNCCDCPKSDEVQKKLANSIIVELRLGRQIYLHKSREEGDLTSETRHEAFEYLQEETFEGAVPKRLMSELEEEVYDDNIQGEMAESIIRCFALWKPHKIVKQGQREEVVFLPAYEDVEVENTNEEEIEQNYRSKVYRFALANGSSLQIKSAEGEVIIHLFGKEVRCANYDMVIDAYIQEIISQVEEEGLVPFRFSTYDDLEVATPVKLIKTADFMVIVKDTPLNISVEEQGREVIVEALVPPETERTQYVIIGDATQNIKLKLESDKVKKQKTRLKTNNAKYYYSTDKAAQKEIVDGGVEFLHTRKAKVLNVRKELDGIGLPLCYEEPFYGKHIMTRVNFFEFIKRLLRIKPRTIECLMLLSSLCFSIRPRALGKYLIAIGAKKETDEKGGRWHWGDPSSLYLATLSYSICHAEEAHSLFFRMGEQHPTALIEMVNSNDLFLGCFSVDDIQLLVTTVDWCKLLGSRKFGLVDYVTLLLRKPIQLSDIRGKLARAGFLVSENRLSLFLQRMMLYSKIDTLGKGDRQFFWLIT